MGMRTIALAGMSALTMMATGADASTLVLYEVDQRTGQRIANSPFADQELSRMEVQGLVRPVVIPIDDAGETVERTVEVVRAQPIAPMGGTRFLNGRVVWDMATSASGGKAVFTNRIASEQGYDNGQGPWTDYRRADVQVRVEFDVPPPRGRVSFARNYTTNRGTFVLLGVVRP